MAHRVLVLLSLLLLACSNSAPGDPPADVPCEVTCPLPAPQPITMTLGPAAAVSTGGPSDGTNGGPSFLGSAWRFDALGTGVLWFPLAVGQGCHLTGWQVHVNKLSPDAVFTVGVVSTIGGTAATVGQSQTSIAGVTGPQTIERALDAIVAPLMAYAITVQRSAGSPEDYLYDATFTTVCGR